MTTPCIVIATFTPTPEHYEEVMEVLLEEGCELYALHEEVEGRLVLVEKWTTRDLWRTHLSLDTVARIQKGIEGLLQCDVEVREMYGVVDSSYPESL